MEEETIINSRSIFTSHDRNSLAVLETAMLRRSPQEICHHIASGHGRNYDDAPVLVVKV